MKLLYFANSRIPTPKAHGYQIMRLCQEFSTQDLTLELILPTRSNREFKNVDPFAYYRQPKNFKVKKIFAFDPTWLLRLPSGTYIKFQSFFFILSLFFYLLGKKNKAAYIFYTRDEYLLPLLKLFSQRLVWEGHSLPRHIKGYLKYFNHCQQLVVLTHQIKKRLVEQGIPADKILVSPTAVDLSVFDIKLDKKSARRRLSLPADKTILGYTGSFTTKNMDKGLADILAALKLIIPSQPDILLVALGGSLKDINFYRSLAESLSLAGHVELRGKVTQAQLAIFQKAADILLMPFPFQEHYAYYMSPLKMFEYMASQRPILASDLPSLREILTDQSAFWAKPGDSADIARTIQHILGHPAALAPIASQAYLDVRKYTWHTKVAALIKFICIS